MEQEGSIPYSQQSTTGPYPEPHEINPHTPRPISRRPHLRLGLLSGIFLSDHSTKILHVNWHAYYIPRPSYLPDLIILIEFVEYELSDVKTKYYE
jgi:hypothetical protein